MNKKSNINISYAMSLEPKQAIAYFESKGHKISFAWQDVWQDAHAKAFTVAGMAKADLLADVQSHVSKALREGRTSNMFADDLIPLLKKRGWWGEVEVANPKTGEVRITKVTPSRVALIFRQNMHGAYNAGRYKQQMENKDAQPYLMYDAVLDQVTRPSHAAVDGTIFRADDSFWDTHYPPNGWGCRCKATALSERGFKKMGGTLTESAGRMVTREVEVKNYNTGRAEKRSVSGFKIDGAKGGREFFTDVGFSYNAGKAFLQGAVQQSLQKLDAMPLAIARPAVEAMVQSEAFALWYASTDMQRGFYPIATIADTEKHALHVTTSVVRISGETLKKQLERHPELSFDDYARVQEVIDTGEPLQKGNTVEYILKEKSGMVAIVKATLKGDELFLVSLWRLSSKDKRLQRILKQRMEK